MDNSGFNDQRPHPTKTQSEILDEEEQKDIVPDSLKAENDMLIIPVRCWKISGII